MGRRDEVLRRAAKAAAANVLHYTGARRAIAAVRRLRSGGRRVLILSYHRVVEDFTGAVQSALPGLLISRETFRHQLIDLRGTYDFVTLDQAMEVMSGKRTARRDLCVVTFDDGYRDVYRSAFPVLRELGIPATVYVSSGFMSTERRFNHDRLFHLFRILQERHFRPVYEALPPPAAGVIEPLLAGQLSLSEAVDTFLADQPGGIVHRLCEALSVQLGGGPELLPQDGEPMTWEEVRQMADAGIEIGAHTVSHTVLPLEDPDRAEWEIRQSKAEIEKHTGKPCRHFAYCNGWYSDEVIRMLVAAGFQTAVTTEDLANCIGGDPFTLKRKVLWENFSVGFDGRYSSCVTGCQLDGVFNTFGGGTVVVGRKPQRRPLGAPVPFTEPEADLHGGI